MKQQLLVTTITSLKEKSLSPELYEQIREDLIKHEGYKEEIYLCSAGLPTFGVGHLILESDPEHSWPVGTPVEKSRVEEVFDHDLRVTINETEKLFVGLDTYPDQCVRVLVNMCFNLGRPRLSKFKKMIKAVKNRDFVEAANQMVDSVWYNQVGRRSVELENWMRNV